MTDLSTALALADADLHVVLAALGAVDVDRRAVTGYQGLGDVDVIDAPGGASIYVRGDELKLIYLGPDQLPEGTSNDALVAAVGTEGELLDSRQGKSAVLHVVADQGVAWSEEGEVGFIELFPPTDLATYQAEIYRQPAPFVR